MPLTSVTTVSYLHNSNPMRKAGKKVICHEIVYRLRYSRLKAIFIQTRLWLPPLQFCLALIIVSIQLAPCVAFTRNDVHNEELNDFIV